MDSMTVKSEGDNRVINNVLRHEYRILNDAEKRWMKEIKDAGLNFMDTIESIGANSRELSLAKTKIEEAVMWAVKHITK